MNRIYQFSGRFTVIGVAAAIAAGLASGFPLALIYAWGIIRIPDGRLSVFATIAYGAALGAAVALAAKWGKIRNAELVGFLAFCAAAVSYYCSWGFWVQDILVHFGERPVDAVALMQQPGELWELIKQINQSGTWGVTSSSTTKGIELWILWGIEALSVPGIAVLTAVSILRHEAFCESCERWCAASQKLILLPVSDLRQTKLALQQRDLSFLQKLGAGNKNQSHLEAHLQSCPSCHNLNTLSLRQTFIQSRKFRGAGFKHVTLVDKLLLSRQEADAFRLTAQGIQQMSKATHA